MSVAFDRTIFFNMVRPMFGGKLVQQQVDGMNYKLDVWCDAPWSDDLRWLAYPLATAKWETGSRMVPVREGFCETDAEARKFVKDQGYAYAKVDPVTGQVYYGRGDIQTTWPENYKKTTSELGLTGDDDLYWHPERMLDTGISARSMYKGMVEGWYRASKDGKRHTLGRYFSKDKDDPYNAREIINGDKTYTKSWMGGLNIGQYIAKDHDTFLEALDAAEMTVPVPVPPVPEPLPPAPAQNVEATFIVPDSIGFTLTINDKRIYWAGDTVSRVKVS